MQRYRSIYTGQEIDTILAQVKDKINIASITNDFMANDPTLVASSEATAAFAAQMDAALDPANLASLIGSAPDSHILTDELYDKLVAINDNFKGVFLNYADRDNTLPIVDLTDLDLVLVIDNGKGSPEFQRWSILDNEWVIIDPHDIHITTTTSAASGPLVVYEYDGTKRSGGKFFGMAKTATEAHVIEFMVLNQGSLTSTISTYAEISMASDLFENIRVQNTDDIIQIVVDAPAVGVEYNIDAVSIF